MRVLAHIRSLPLALLLSSGCATAPAPEPAREVVHAAPDPERQADRYPALVVAANDKARAGDFGAALRFADLALQLRPFGLEAGVAKVEAHLAQGERTEALDFAERLRARHPSRGEAHYACGKALYALGRLTAAQDAFADGIIRMPNDRLLLLAQLTALTHDPDVPLSELQARADELIDPAKASPDDGDVWHALAMANELRGDDDDADALYVRAIAARPVHPFAHYNLALLRQSKSGMASARPHFQAFLDQAPPSAVREVEAVEKLLEENRHE